VVHPFHASARNILAERRMIGQLIEQHGIRIVHTHGYRPDIVDLPVARNAGIACISTLHGFTGGDWKVRLYERIQLRTLTHTDAVVAVSRSVYDRARRYGVSANVLHTIRNAYTAPAPFASRVHARHALCLDDTRTHIAWIGRLSHEKGPDVMLEAMGVLNDPQIALSLVGDGPMREPLRARAEALGVADRVTFHGIVVDAARLLPAFDLFALSSRTEGTPMVLLEAMAAGIPIVATAVGGVPDVVSTHEAILVPAERPEELANAIRAIVAAPADAIHRTEAAHTRLATTFGVDTWLDDYEALYRSILH
jgi:glycosyltransferase involved in cell wall biosynthesis